MGLVLLGAGQVWAAERPIASTSQKQSAKTLKTKLGKTSPAPQLKKAKKAESKPAARTTPKAAPPTGR